MLKIALYASNHGYGHASRVSALADSFCKFGVFTWVCTNRPKFLFNDLDPDYFQYRECRIDHGVIHKANLVTDVDATKAALLELFASRDEIVAEETEFLRKNEIDLVIADIPFFVVEACGYANVPVFGVSNFDWAFVYGEIFESDLQMKPIINTIWGLYRRMDKSYLLSFGNLGSIPGFLNPKSMGLIARQKDIYPDIYQSMNVNYPILLVMFGGEGGIDLSWEELCSAWKGTVVSTNTEVKAKNHICINPDADFLSLIYHADTILCKPGYSTFAELAQFGKPLLYIPRNNYPEERVLIEGIDSYQGAICVSNPQINKAEWKKLLASAKSSRPVQNMNLNLAGTMLHDYLEISYPDHRIISVFDLGSNNLNYCLFNKTNGTAIHRNWCTTKLGRNFSKSSLSFESIEDAKKAMTSILEIDNRISSQKYLVATGVSRQADNSSELLQWFRSDWNIKSKVISGFDEMKYAYLAGSHSLEKRNKIIVCDIGGFSTEIAFKDMTKKLQGFSCDMGLITLAKDSERKQRLSEFASRLPDGKYDIVLVGLTATLLAKYVRKEPLDFISHSTHNINAEDLYIFLDDCRLQGLKQDAFHSYEANAMQIAGEIAKQIVDRYKASSFMVSNNGISTGYALWIK